MRIRLAIERACFATLILIAGAATALAQPGNLLDPTDPRVTVPTVKYESAFSAYMPFREEKIRSWREVNQEVAHDGMGSMGSMKDKPGQSVPGMDKQPASGPMSQTSAAGHDMGATKDTPAKSMPGMDRQAAGGPMSKTGAAGHDMGAMKDPSLKTMPGMDKQAATAPVSKEGRDSMAMAKPQTAPGQSASARAAGITGTGVVQGIDKANGKVKLTHDPIATLGWPKMTMFFRLKDGALADQLKEGDRVEFTLEQAASGYVISGFQKGTPSEDMKQVK